MSKWITAAFVAALTVSSAAAEEDCRLQIAASLPLQLNASNRVTVPASIDGHPVQLLVDTGSPQEILQESKAQEFGLRYEAAKRWDHGQVFGGIKLSRQVTAKEFVLGKLKASGMPFMLMPDDQRKIIGADGLLGANVIFTYDADFDFANAKMNLFLPHRCPGRVVYWTQDENAIAKIPMTLDGGHVRVSLTADGQPIDAVIDTGASGTVLDLETYMPKFGLTPQSPGVKAITVPGEDTPHYVYTFKQLSFGGVTVANAKVVFISRKYSQDRDYDMLLGMDVLRELHLFFAYKEKMLYITAASQH